MALMLFSHPLTIALMASKLLSKKATKNVDVTQVSIFLKTVTFVEFLLENVA